MPTVSFHPSGYAHQGVDLSRSLPLTALGAVRVAMVLSSTLSVWLPQSWGVPGRGPEAVGPVLSSAGFTWMGVLLPVLLLGATVLRAVR